MKTRSNMPLFVVECTDVKALTKDQIDLLRCGDYLVKKDSSGEHAYKVTFKKEGVGMCLTYVDASVIETQSYDYVDGAWVYNSEDKTPNLLELQNVEDAPAGTISNVLGLDANGDLVKGIVSGGTQLYKHHMVGKDSDNNELTLDIINNVSTTYTTFNQFDLSNSIILPSSEIRYQGSKRSIFAFGDSVGPGIKQMIYVTVTGTLGSATSGTLTSDTVTPL